ncbi:methionyl-tRNA formyltransferase [Striga asiatica]|uniref:Methionyl-tRNA formyltransferase n=1 Tax=Striga asiatica TaxID=4170 RepID=A0A5A7R458_STRAF|nr:methionyl-tRNA formyltransferase [Striga asiatica]
MESDIVPATIHACSSRIMPTSSAAENDRDPSAGPTWTRKTLTIWFLLSTASSSLSMWAPPADGGAATVSESAILASRKTDARARAWAESSREARISSKLPHDSLRARCDGRAPHYRFTGGRGRDSVALLFLVARCDGRDLLNRAPRCGRGRDSLDAAFGVACDLKAGDSLNGLNACDTPSAVLPDMVEAVTPSTLLSALPATSKLAISSMVSTPAIPPMVVPVPGNQILRCSLH